MTVNSIADGCVMLCFINVESDECTQSTNAAKFNTADLLINERSLIELIEKLLSLSYRKSVCLSSVCNVRAPYSGRCKFRQYFFAILYLSHPSTSVQNRPSEPISRGRYTQEG